MAAFSSPAIALPSTFVVPNDQTVGGTLAVTGAMTLAATVAASLVVTGATTLSSTATVTGLLTPTGGMKTPVNLYLYATSGGF